MVKNAKGSLLHTEISEKHQKEEFKNGFETKEEKKTQNTEGNIKNKETEKNPHLTKLEDWIESHSQILVDPWTESDCCSLEHELATKPQINPDGDEGEEPDPGILDPTFDRENEEESTWSGQYNKMGQLHGSGILRLYDGDTFTGSYIDGLRSGWGIVTSSVGGISSLTGVWEDGYLQGKIRLVTSDTSVVEGWCRYSKLNGPARTIIMKKFRTFRQQVSWLGRYKDGVHWGQCWQWVEGGGYITGRVNSEGKMTGPDIGFLYPDLCTALVGQFEDGQMVRAYPAVLDTVQIENDIAVPHFSRLSVQSVRYMKSCKTNVGDNPLVEDPYESRTCQVLTSAVEGGGEGLYARRKIKEGEIVAFYNGVRLPYLPGEKEEWDTSGYKIFVNADYKSGERIDLPGSLIYTENYRATLGHKMNHSFEPNCTEWFFDHPRHDLIPCAVARTPIEPGEELFLHYGYDPLNCPSWYSAALDEYLSLHPNLELWELADPERLDKEKLPWYKDSLATLHPS